MTSDAEEERPTDVFVDQCKCGAKSHTTDSPLKWGEREREREKDTDFQTPFIYTYGYVAPHLNYTNSIV